MGMGERDPIKKEMLTSCLSELWGHARRLRVHKENINFKLKEKIKWGI